jgi:FlaA1/EpsC-like NDP-sugar epimerase
VPTCEYFPTEAVRTNVLGPENIVSIIETEKLPVKVVVGVSTDKACKPVNVMGMTKAIQERVFIQGNMRCGSTRIVCVRYGNVLASRGSVIPLFHDQIRRGGPVTITTPEMTRFLLSLDDAVDTIFAAVREGKPGDTYIPRAPAARMTDLAKVLIGDRPIKTVITGIRPGEKVHEILISEEEAQRVEDRGRFYAIRSLLPEVQAQGARASVLQKEYSSGDELLEESALRELLVGHKLMVGDVDADAGELLR